MIVFIVLFDKLFTYATNSNIMTFVVLYVYNV
jgi:hypothetical protein